MPWRGGVVGMTLSVRLLLVALSISTGLAPAAAETQAGALAEFRQRQITTFNTFGHAKANGLEVSLRFPASWRAEEGRRPHVVQQFVQPGQPVICNLLIREVGETLSAADARALVSPDNMLTLLPRNAERATSSVTALDGLPAAEAIYETALDSGGASRRRNISPPSGAA